jgi:hypothetical protein
MLNLSTSIFSEKKRSSVGNGIDKKCKKAVKNPAVKNTHPLLT